MVEEKSDNNIYLSPVGMALYFLGYTKVMSSLQDLNGDRTTITTIEINEEN